jgi:hypothetical protein
MKQYFRIVFLATIVLTIFAFNKIPVCIYYVYDGTGDEKNISNYAETFAQPAACPGTGLICWFKVCDTNGDGLISLSEWNARFESLDVVNDEFDLLSDETFEIPGVLEFCAPD